MIPQEKEKAYAPRIETAEAEADLPIFLRETPTREIFQDAIESIPKGTKVFLVGGAVRNALYYDHFGEALPQRDYDLVLMGDAERYIANLRKEKFTYGKIKRRHEVVVKKKKVPHPRQLSDYVYLDIHFREQEDILRNLQKHSSFTINGFALPLERAASSDWQESVIALPGAAADLRNRLLHVNKITHPANMYACLRFISLGFEPPSSQEVRELLHALKKLPKYKFERNRKKVFDYVGGEEKARNFVRQLGINEDIFDFRVVKRLDND